MSSEESGPELEIRKWRLRLEDLSPEVRAEIRSLYKVRRWMNSIVLLYPLVWIFSIACVERWPVLPVRIAGILVIGISVQAMGTLMHEAVHGELVPSRLLRSLGRIPLGRAHFLLICRL